MSPLKMRDLLEGSDIARWRFQQNVLDEWITYLSNNGLTFPIVESTII